MSAGTPQFGRSRTSRANPPSDTHRTKPARSHPLKSQALCMAWQPPEGHLFGHHPAEFLDSHEWAVDVVGRTEIGLMIDSP